jgi:bifunctional non-homologous end joining protein LigD
MSLREYQSKRNFRQTPEPPAHTGKNCRQLIFVVQEHQASHLHYDFRLEAEGVLKSWAIPKGPSMDPSQKRLAVRVEDHPLAYAKFAGTIPEGQYGAGTVGIWDHGTYEPITADKSEPRTVAEAIKAGRLDFVMHGEKLGGQFALVRMRGGAKENWLLIKRNDEFARMEKAPPQAPQTRSPRQRSKKAVTGRRSAGQPSTDGDVDLTHPERVIFPALGLTKADVFDYYRRIAPRLLPYLRDRPITLERLPEGLGGADKPHFWQKNTPAYYPDWVPRVKLPSAAGKLVHYALVNDERTLLYLVNQGALTFHVWFSRVENVDRPDFVLFDLDPGEATFANVVLIAKRLHALLQTEDQDAFVKTSGKTGLHVLVPWTAAGGYEEARAWALGVAERIVAELPKQATVERSKSNRKGRVYVDVMQNARGHHVVPPYVLRAIPAATVSAPLTWREIGPDLDPGQFTLRTMFRRLSRQKTDPMAPLLRKLN